jgi:hypothetical protein
VPSCTRSVPTRRWGCRRGATGASCGLEAILRSRKRRAASPTCLSGAPASRWTARP